MLSYLDNFRDIVNHGKPERKKEFIRAFVKSVVMDPESKQGRIALYTKPLSGIIMENKQCEQTEEIVYQN
ncbi:MAG: hypothetical protein HQ558_03625 [Candidatus Omnitrophica bacterium]|nr:hypothetical protein [Candidatus Omnitrophota bacterium]